MSEVELGGRRFKVVDFDRRTVLNDHYLMATIQATGADKVVPMGDEGDDAYIVRLQSELVRSRRIPDIVAGILLDPEQDETDFDIDKAKKLSAFIAKLNTPQDREVVLTLSVHVVMGFFRQGLSWLSRFRSSFIDGSELSSPGAQSATRTVPV